MKKLNNDATWPRPSCLTAPLTTPLILALSLTIIFTSYVSAEARLGLMMIELNLALIFNQIPVKFNMKAICSTT